MSLTLQEARTRAELLHDVHVRVHLDLTSTEDFAVDATVRFGCRTPGASTFLELAEGREVTLDGERAAFPALVRRLGRLQQELTTAIHRRRR